VIFNAESKGADSLPNETKESLVNEALTSALFALTPEIRYVAHARGQKVEMRARQGLQNASASDSDRYEELLVNPTLLTLARQRGEIDCGGLSYIIVGYRNFHQLVLPLDGGHLSIAFELAADPLTWLGPVAELLEDNERA
jgi:hypothetical protein